jgi:transposase-like protein
MSSTTRPSRHFSGSQKSAAVQRILRGEPLERVAAELTVSVDRLRRWERIFLEGGEKHLANHRDNRSRLGNNGQNLLPWAGLLLLLTVIVYAASRFFQRGLEP